jgi:hypothetical protein
MSANPVRHDYTLETYKSGWAIVGFEFFDAGMARIEAFGLKVLPGEEIVISMPDGEVLYEISKIRYEQDPYDLYEAEVKYVQHLTGRPSLGHTDIQAARSVEWIQHHSTRHMHITEYGSRPSPPWEPTIPLNTICPRWKFQIIPTAFEASARNRPRKGTVQEQTVYSLLTAA